MLGRLGAFTLGACLFTGRHKKADADCRDRISNVCLIKKGGRGWLADLREVFWFWSYLMSRQLNLSFSLVLLGLVISSKPRLREVTNLLTSSTLWVITIVTGNAGPSNTGLHNPVAVEKSPSYGVRTGPVLLCHLLTH